MTSPEISLVLNSKCLRPCRCVIHPRFSSYLMKIRLFRCIMKVVLGVSLVLVVVLAILVGLVHSGPLHAQCTVHWTFGKSCETVSDAIVNQINNWTTADNCKQGGQRCLYKLKSASSSEVKATHETPVKHYIDDLTFNLAAGANATTCSGKGYSRSQIWYAVLDFGTNYCNLENLITGAGLDKLPGYSEDTNDGICTQYSSHDCDKY